MMRLFPQSWRLNRIEAHVERRLQRTPLELEPFPHLVLRDCLPLDFYQHLLSRWPENEQMCALSGQNRALTLHYRNNYGWRHQLTGRIGECVHIIDNDEIMGNQDWLSKEGAPWQEFELVIRSILFPRLWDVFDLYIRAAVAACGAKLPSRSYRSGELFSRSNGFALGQHTDNRCYLVTVLFYFASDLSQKHLGTQLFKALRPATEWADPYSMAPQYTTDCVLARQPAFTPNTLLAFVNSPNSLHGNPPIGPEPRNIYINYLVADPAQMADALSDPKIRE